MKNAQLSYVAALVEGKRLFVSYYARVPLNSGFRTTGGTRTTV
jgi:hypothetical protein